MPNIGLIYVIVKGIPQSTEKGRQAIDENVSGDQDLADGHGIVGRLVDVAVDVGKLEAGGGQVVTLEECGDSVELR